MPRRKFAPKRKLIRRKRWARRPKRVVVNRSLQPVPQRYICKMKYAEDVGTLGAGQYRFNLNSLFDPNRSGLGHQAHGFDTYSSLYNRYRVISCGWRINTVLSAATQTSIQVAAIPANEELTFLTMSELRENPRAKYITQAWGGNIQYLSGKCYLPSLVGRTKAQYMADDRYQAQVNASPSELAILNVYTATNVETPSSYTIQIVLEYTVEFFDVKHLAQS